MNEEEKRAAQLDYQMLQEQIKQLNKELAVFDQQMRTMQVLSKNLDDIKMARKDSEMFSELGSGVFVRTALKDTDEVLVNVGASVAVRKKVDDAKRMVDEQVMQLREALSKTELEMQKCAFQVQILQQRFLAEKKA